jgi:hypothetical protein
MLSEVLVVVVVVVAAIAETDVDDVIVISGFRWLSFFTLLGNRIDYIYKLVLYV